jgi:hydrogenase expression/formation protein HypC
MCLAIPGKIISIENEDSLLRSGKVDFGGIFKQVNLACLPDAQIGDYVLVHVGFGISKIDEAEARQVFEYLRQMEQIDEMEENGK